MDNSNRERYSAYRRFEFMFPEVNRDEFYESRDSIKRRIIRHNEDLDDEIAYRYILRNGKIVSEKVR